jgi:hypothetical protein
LVYALALAKFVLPFLLQHPVYEPHRDEFLYLAEGRHLSWGYVEAPPLLSLLSWFSDMLGAGFFWIKFWPALFGAMTYILVGRMILLLGGGRFALLLGFLPFIGGYFLQLHFLLAPGFLGVYFQTLMIYGLVRYLRSGRTRGLYLMGLGFGLGMLSQYSHLLFTGWLLIGLLLTPGRQLFRNRHFYLAFLLGLLLFLPNILWQTMHGWPAIREWNRPDLDFVLDFFRDQLTFNLPSLFIWVSGLFWVAWTEAGREYRFAGWTVLGMTATLVLLRENSDRAMGLYPVLFCFGAVALERALRFERKVWRYGLLGFTVLTGFVMDTVFLPMMPPKELAAYYSWNPVFRRLGFLSWPDRRDHALPQRFAEMLGWEEMALKAARAYESLDSLDKTRVLLNSGENYGEGGALDYYGPKYSLPPVMSRGADYALWTPAAYYDRDVFIVTATDCGDMKKFASATLLDSVTHPYSAEYRSYIILMRGPNAEVRQEWKKGSAAEHRGQLAAR